MGAHARPGSVRAPYTAERLTAARLLDLAQRISNQRSIFEAVYPCECDWDPSCVAVPDEPIYGVAWTRCPRGLLREPWLLALDQVEAVQAVAPLDAHRLAAWVVDLLGARRRRQA